MLIRVGGGLKGIAHYLKTGQKKGRQHTRDELDDRVILIGDLDAMNEAVNALAKGGEKYLHVTLSFREDFLAPAILKEIAEKFQHFIKAAYRDDELMCYAEAHVPKIKALAVEGPEKRIDRFVHIHFIVPKLNLLTLKAADPLGRVARQIPYLNAFQEWVNSTYGLASPKDNRRVGLENGSTVVARHNGENLNAFTGPNRDLKTQILEKIIEGDISSTVELHRHLETLGQVKVRNPGTSDAYFNLKRPTDDKGINLKEVMFSEEFLSLGRDEKRTRLFPVSKAAQFTEVGAPRSADQRHLELLQEWRLLRAKEVKYLDSGRKAEWSAYSTKSTEDKVDYIKGLEDKHYHGIGTASVEPEVETSSPESETRPDSPPEPVFLEHSNTTLGQRIREIVDGHLDRVYRSRLSSSPIRESEGDVRKFLAAKYQLPFPKFSKPLEAACANGTTGVYEFLRKNLNLAPNVSWVNVVKLGLIQPQGKFSNAENSVSDLLWDEFKRRKKKLEEDQKLEDSQRRHAMSVLQMSLVLSRKHLWAQHQLAQDLEQGPLSAVPDNEVNSISGANPEASKPYEAHQGFRVGDWDQRTNEIGQVVLLHKAKPVIRDEEVRLVVEVTNVQVVEVALRVAVLKFGPKLLITGGEAFKKTCVEVAAGLKVRIEFANPDLQMALQVVRAQQQEGWSY